MKTAVSVPDDLFRRAEAAARRLRMSRSRLFTTALSEFLERQQSNAVTDRLSEVYSHRRAKLDSALHRAPLKSLDKEPWEGTRGLHKGGISLGDFPHLALAPGNRRPVLF